METVFILYKDFATEDEVTPGDIIKVKILDADEYDLTGQAEV